MEGARSIRLPDGRQLAVDDVGDRRGTPVVYLHGTPDSRLARHPDDRLAAAHGVRLLALDRPGAGDSDPHPGSRLADLAPDIAFLLDELDLPRAGLLGWSSGGLFALASAAALGERVAAVCLVGPVPPVEAYDTPEVVASLGPHRRPFAELARELEPGELAAEVAPYLVPRPLDHDLALAHVLEGAGERGRAELASVPGAAERMARALEAALQAGDAGLEHDLARQLEAGLDLGAVGAPVRTFHGTEDAVSPPEVGSWLCERLPRGRLEVVPGAAHHLLFPHWTALLDALVADVAAG